MESLEIEETKYPVKKIAENQNIILEVQKNFDAIQNSETAFMATRDQTIGLKTSQRLSDWLNKLERVEEVNFTVRNSRNSLVEEITNLKECLDCATLRRKSRDKYSPSQANGRYSLPIPNAEMQSTKYKGLALSPKGFFKSTKSSRVPLSKEEYMPKIHIINEDAKPSGTTQNKKKKNIGSKVSKALKKFVGYGCEKNKQKQQKNGNDKK